MTDKLTVELSVNGFCRVLHVGVKLFNAGVNASYIRSEFFSSDDFAVGGVSDVPCSLSPESEPRYNESVALRILPGGHLYSKHLPLSALCDFHNAVPGKYYAIYSSNILVYPDDNLVDSEASIQSIGISKSFELDAGC